MDELGLSHLESIPSLAIVGATGLVGREVINILSEKRIRIPKIKALASRESLGENIEYGDQNIMVEELTPDSFRGVYAALFCAPTEISREYIPHAVDAGTLVVDDSSAYRMRPDVPLVVPEINAETLRSFTGLVMATPNCSTTPLVLVLKPLLEKYGLERVVVSSYQSVSGAGRSAYQELSEQSAALLSGQGINRTESDEIRPSVFPHRIAFNCIPIIGEANESGESSEEVKIQNESRKILGLKNLRVTATAVRVPTFGGHGLSVNIELTDTYESIDQIRELLEVSPGLHVLDSPGQEVYPTNAECVGEDGVYVGRIRRDNSVESGVNLWIIGDNIRKGAALNALQILDGYLYYRRLN